MLFDHHEFVNIKIMCDSFRLAALFWRPVNSACYYQFHSLRISTTLILDYLLVCMWLNFIFHSHADNRFWIQRKIIATKKKHLHRNRLKFVYSFMEHIDNLVLYYHNCVCIIYVTRMLMDSIFE